MKLSLPDSILNIFQSNNKRFIAGIAILSDKVQLVKAEPNGEKYKCVAFVEIPISNEDQTISALVKLINDYSLTSAKTTIVLPANKVESTQIERSELPENDIQTTLPWKVKDLINIAPMDMICDYIEMPLQPTGQQPKAQVLAVAKSYLEKITQPFHDEKAAISAITTEQFALAKLQQTGNASQLIFIQHKKMDGTLLIVKNQEICFARKIRNTAPIVDMTPEQLEMGGSDTIAIEIQRSIDYYESQLKQPPIKNALLAMEGNNAELMITALNKVLPVKTKLIPLDNLESDQELDPKFISAVGAALYMTPSQPETPVDTTSDQVAGVNNEN